MKTVCSWCQRVIKDGPPAPLSHGICADCAEDFAWNTHSVRVAQDDTLSERGKSEVAAAAGPSPRSENVYPLFHEQIDEAS